MGSKPCDADAACSAACAACASCADACADAGLLAGGFGNENEVMVGIDDALCPGRGGRSDNTIDDVTVGILGSI